MKSNERELRKLIRNEVKRMLREDAQASADWYVDKLSTALDAATNKDKDYQYAAAFDSDEFKKLVSRIKQKKQNEAKLKESFYSWLSGKAQKFAGGIIDRRTGYLTNALKDDPKLQRIAKTAGLSSKDFESRVYSLMGRDRNFLQSLATAKFKFH